MKIASSNGVQTRLETKIGILSEVFDTVIVVDTRSKSIIDTRANINSNRGCGTKCPLFNDKSGCICREAVSSNEARTKIIVTDTDAYLVVAQPLKMQHSLFSLVMIKRLDSAFSFGASVESTIVEQVTNVSSGLVRDKLTKIFNRNYLENNIGYQLNNCKLHGKNLSIAAIDIDNFKQFNDNYGHDFGDKVLITLADKMSMICQQDKGMYPVRIGGDEFIIIGNDVDKTKFKALMNRLCTEMQSTKLLFKQKRIGICISIGVANSKDKSVYDFKELYKDADEHLYMAKDAGKNCVR